jgi:ribokinase
MVEGTRPVFSLSTEMDQFGEIRSLPAFDARAIDTTAAGDAFNSGFAVGLMKGMSVVESARFASAVAAISVTRHGAQTSMPTLSEEEQRQLSQFDCMDGVVIDG